MKKLYTILILLCTLVFFNEAHATLRDSLINELQTTADDSVRMRNAYIYSQEHLDRFWALDLLDIGIETAIKQKHITWELAMRGSKVRWAHRHHDWTRMDKFLAEQREAAFRLNEFGNYFGQVAQSAIVMNGLGRYEKSRELYEHMKMDIERAGGDMLRQQKMLLYIISADYHKSRGENKKNIEIYLEALKDTTLIMSDSQRMSFYSGLVETFVSLHRHSEALAYADSVLAIFNTYSEAKRNLPNSRVTIMELFLNRASVYEHIGNIDMMKENILTAEAYAGVMSHHERAKIYRMWAHYYNAIGDHERTMENIDKAVKEYMNDDFYEQAAQMEIEKAMPLWAMGRREEAIELYKTQLAKMELMHQDLISDQQSFLDKQTEILHQQQRSIELRTWASYVMAIIAAVVTLFAISMLIYGLFAYRTVKKNYRITRRKLREAKEADRMKENFLRNITALINEPLQHVVYDAKRLATDRSLTPSEQQHLVRHSKEHVVRLMALVNNVLDLSRLEACMMKYTQKEADLVALTEQCVSEYLFEQDGELKINIDKQVDSFVKQTDTTRFSNIMKGLFASPVDHLNIKPERIDITLASPSPNKLVITIVGSLFADESDFTEAERMTNNINRCIMRDFNGTYDVADGRIVITILR